MKPGRENAAGIHIGAGLSGYVASLCQATLCAEYGLPNELHDSHASYIHHWMKILRGERRQSEDQGCDELAGHVVVPQLSSRQRRRRIAA